MIDHEDNQCGTITNTSWRIYLKFAFSVVILVLGFEFQLRWTLLNSEFRVLSSSCFWRFLILSFVICVPAVVFNSFCVLSFRSVGRLLSFEFLVMCLGGSSFLFCVLYFCFVFVVFFLVIVLCILSLAICWAICLSSFSFFCLFYNCSL